MAKPPRSEPLKPLRLPLMRPMGVRAPATMTVGSVLWVEAVLTAVLQRRCRAGCPRAPLMLATRSAEPKAAVTDVP